MTPWTPTSIPHEQLMPGDLLVAKDDRVWMVSSIHPPDTYPDPDREDAGVVIVRGAEIHKRAFPPGHTVTVLRQDQGTQP